MDYNITYRPKDKGWQYIISYKIDEDSGWKQTAKQGFRTKKEAKPIAEKKVLELKMKYKNGNTQINKKSDSITFKELSDAFVEHSKLYKEANTIKNYKGVIFAFDRLVYMKVKDIKKIHVQACVDKLIKEGKAYNTIKSNMNSLNMTLKYYKDNYDTSFEIPKEIILPKKGKVKDKKALTKKDLDELLQKMKKYDDECYIISLIAGYCGLRIGEILGLTWKDVKKTELNVDKQWKITKDSIGFGSTKNNKVRSVPLPVMVKNELLDFKNNHPTDLTNRIIINKYNTIIHKVDKKLKEFANISVHELRHTYTTLLVQHGLDFKTIALLIGDDVLQVIKTYSHVTDDMYKNAKNEIKNIF